RGGPTVTHGVQRPIRAGERRAREKRHAGHRSMFSAWLEVAGGKPGPVHWRGRVTGSDAAGPRPDSIRWRNCQLDPLRGFVRRLLPDFFETPARSANRTGRTVRRVQSEFFSTHARGDRKSVV